VWDIINSYFAGQSILFVEEIVKYPATRLNSKDTFT
jgi:hypothetical protein